MDKKIAWKQPFGMQVSTPIVHNQLFHAVTERRFANLFLNYDPYGSAVEIAYQE